MALDLRSLREALPPASGGPSYPLDKEEGPPLEIKVMSWNINGRGSAQDRNRLVPLVVRETRPDVLLLQETKTDVLVSSIKSQAREVGILYEQISADDKTEARVLYDSRRYEAISPRDDRVFPGRGGSGRISLAEALERSIPEEEHRELRGRISLAEALERSIPEEEHRELRGRAAGGMRQLYRRRIAIVGLKRREHELVPNRVTIFMSFHNVNTSQGGETRERAARGFCQIVQSVRELTGTVVIAGADLNQQMRPDTPSIPRYKPTLRRSTRIIDYFILASPLGRMEHDPVIALDIMGARDDPLNALHRVMAHLLRPSMSGRGHSMEDYGRALDHDPLICEVLVRTTTELRYTN